MQYYLVIIRNLKQDNINLVKGIEGAIIRITHKSFIRSNVSFVLFVKKQDESFRLCIYYYDLNKV